MAIFQKSHFKLTGYLNFRLGRRVDSDLKFRKISKFISQNFEILC